MKTVDGVATNNVDCLIDAAAAEMTDAIPAAGFSARVLANLDRTPRFNWFPVVSGTAAAAVIVVLALWLPRLGDRRQPDIADVHAGPSALASNTTSALSPSAPAPSVARVPTTSRAPAISPDEAAWLSRSVLPLAGSPAIAIEAIQPERSTIAPISVQPLVAEPIEVTPLVSPSHLNGGR
jgi:hypothetical protein